MFTMKKIRFLRRLGGAVLSAGMLLGLLSGCGVAAPAEAGALPTPAATAPEEGASSAATPEPTSAPEPMPEETAAPDRTDGKPDDGPEPQNSEVEALHGSSGFTDFDSSLIAFLEESGLKRESFMVSPLSFRAALALAVSGAEGTTKEALLRAMGFSSMEEVAAWYSGLLEGVEAFQKELDQEKAWLAEYPEEFSGGGSPDRAYSIVNSIWHNADREGGFREDYVQRAKELFDAAARELPGAELAGAVNDWVNEETRGMIPSIADDLSDTDAVLVNALYLRTSWISTFSAYATRPGDFTTVDGDTVVMDFMHQQDGFPYYEDGETQLVILPMKGNIKAAFVLGDTGDIAEKLNRAQWQEVSVALPKFELETTLGSGKLEAYLERMGAGEAMTGAADFSAMSGLPWCISEIIQKSRIQLDEDGIEAAAVTAILMEATAAAEPPQPKMFVADHPFAFYLYQDGGDTPELLFYGQYM